MKKQFFQVTMAIGCAAGISFCSGCVGQGVNTGIEIGTTNVNNFGAGPRGQEIKSAPAQPLVKTNKMIVLDQHQDLLRLVMNPEGVSNEEKALAVRIGTLVSNAVSSNDAIVGCNGSQDVRLSIRPKLTLVDQTGDYYRMNCTADLELKAVVSGQILAGHSIKIVGSRRVLGKEAAIAQFDESVSKAAAAWCRGELKRIADNEINVVVLDIQLPTLRKGQEWDVARDSARIHAIGENLAKMPNFISYELVGQDAQKGTCQYRIAYFRRSYPSGIANEIGALLKTIVEHK